MTLSFRYKAIKRKDGLKVKCPYIPITIKGDNSENIDVMALLDSGADISVIPEELAKFLGLSLKGKIEESTGIGGKVKVISTNMNVSLKKGHEDYNFRIPVQVLIENSDSILILGRRGFFDKFEITFDEQSNRIKLKRVVIGTRY